MRGLHRRRWGVGMSGLTLDEAYYVNDREGRTWGRMGGCWYWMSAPSTYTPTLPDGGAACRGTLWALHRDFGPLTNPRRRYEVSAPGERVDA